MSVGNLSVTLELDGAGNFVTSIQRAAAATKQFGAQATMSAAAANQLSQTMGRSANPFQNMNAALNTALKAHRSNTQAIGSHFGGFSKLVIVLGQAQLAFNSLKTVTYDWGKQIVDTNAKMESLLLLLKGVSVATTEVGRTQEALGNFNMLLQKASSSPFSLGKITDSFIKLKGAGIEPTERTLQSLIDATAHFGGDDQVLQRAALAFQQMAGKGVVSMEELRRQLGDAIPGALKAMASAMNLTVGELVRKVGTGTLEAKNAIYQLSAEFERLYGGAAMQKLATYSGQVALMTTNFQKLALVAGGQNDQGGYSDGSFFKNITDNLKEFNKYLKTPEVAAFAVSVNNALNSVVNGLVTASKFFREWGVEIVAATTAVIGMTASLKLLNAAYFAFSAVKSGEFAVKFRETQPILTFLIDNMRNLQTASSATFAAVSAGVAGYASSIKNLFPLFTSGFAGVNAAILAGQIGIGGFVAGLAAVAAPIAVLAGLAAIIYKLKDIKTYSDVATNAIKRVAQGDFTEKNESAAKRELDRTAELIKGYQKLAQDIDAVRSGAKKSVLPQDMGGAYGVEGLKAPIADQSQSFFALEMGVVPDTNIAINKANVASKQIEQFYDQLLLKIKELTEANQKGIADVMNTPQKREDAYAEARVEAIEEGVNHEMQAYRNAYRDRDNELEALRMEIAGKNDRVSLEARKNIDLQKAQNRENLAGQSLGQYDKAIDAEKNKLKDALDQQQELVAGQQNNILARMFKAREEIAKTAAESAAEAGKIVMLGDNGVASAVKSAEGHIERLKANIAGLAEQADGGSKSLGKLQKMLADGGEWGKIPEDSKKSLVELTKQFEEGAEKAKGFKQAMAEQGKIDLALDKTSADLERWNAAITDPNATEAQRNFSSVQLQMKQSLEILEAKFKSGAISALEYGNALVQTNQAVAQAAAASTSMEIESLLRLGKAKKLASLDPESRAKEQASLDSDRFTKARDGLKKDVEAGIRQQEEVDKILANLGNAEKESQLKPISVTRASSGAARREDNAATGMASRIAQLKAQISGANPELAKWNSLLADGRYAGRANEFRSMATEAGRLEEVLRKVRISNEAFDSLKNGVTDTANSAQEAQALNEEIDKRGRLLGIEKQLYDFRQAENKKVRAVESAPNTDGYRGAELAAQARANADQAATNKARELSQLAMANNRSETEQILASAETSLAGRRDAGYKAVEYERVSQQRVIDAANFSATERARIEDELAQTIAAKRMQVERQTETGLERWVRESSDLETNMSNFATQGISQLQDAFIGFAETGKFSFTDLASWGIKELTRITLSKAFSTLMSSVMGGGAGGGGGGGGGFSWLGLAQAAIGAFGGGAGMGATGAKAAGAAGGFQTQGVIYHAGGMVGEGSISRAISAAHLQSAPRFHTGTYLAKDEVPAILQKGEGVFTAGQMSQIGRMNHDYTSIGSSVAAMSAAVSRLAATPRVPPSFAPTGNYDPSERVQAAAASGGAAPAMTVNLNNQTGSGMGATAAQPRFDGERWVVDIVLKNVNQPGALRTAINGAKT